MATFFTLAVASAPGGLAARFGGVDLAPPGFCPGADQPAVTPHEAGAALECLIDYARREAGLPVLAPSAVLSHAALLRAVEDTRCDELSHTPCGVEFISTFLRAGYVSPTVSFVVGENLAFSPQDASPRQIMTAWLHSPEHRANILNPRYSQLGSSVDWVPRFVGYGHMALWVIDFGVVSSEPVRSIAATD